MLTPTDQLNGKVPVHVHSAGTKIFFLNNEQELLVLKEIFLFKDKNTIKITLIKLNLIIRIHKSVKICIQINYGTCQHIYTHQQKLKLQCIRNKICF